MKTRIILCLLLANCFPILAQKSKGKELLRSPLTLNLWRAPLANELDEWNSRTARSVNWREGFGSMISTEMYSTGIDKLTHQPLSFETEEKNNEVHVIIQDLDLTGRRGSGGLRNNYEFIIAGDGKMTLRHRMKPEGILPLWFPRVGITMTIDKSLNRVEWYGRGPQENYPDRKSGYRIGIYQSSVHDMYEPYLIPQDLGCTSRGIFDAYRALPQVYERVITMALCHPPYILR